MRSWRASLRAGASKPCSGALLPGEQSAASTQHAEPVRLARWAQADFDTQACMLLCKHPVHDAAEHMALMHPPL